MRREHPPASEVNESGVVASRKQALGQNLLLVLAALLFTLLAIELLLQGAAFVMRRASPETAEIAAQAAGTNRYRILCLGESTTRGYGEIPYPTILAEELNARGYGRSFQVVNAGFTSWASSGLIQQLPRLLDRTRPDMVIVMMGVNDQFYFSRADGLAVPVRVEAALLKSRLYKLLRLLVWNLRARLGMDAIPREAPPREWEALGAFQRRFDEAHARWVKRRLEEPGTVFAELIEAARSLEASRPGSGSETIAVPREALRAYYNLYLDLAQHHLESGDGQAAVALYQEAIATHPDAEFFYRGLSGVYDEIGEDALAEEFRLRAERIADRQVLAVTRQSYRELRRLLDARGIELVAMQYPLRDVRRLRVLLDDAEDLIYVDNEENFRSAIAADGYDALFIDRFAGDFGHCNERGNRLIVDNLITTVFEPAFGRHRGQ